jgi:hypothetical protein
VLEGILDVIQSVGFETELPRLAIGYLEDALTILKEGADHTECLKGWEKRAGIEVKTSEQPKDKVVEEKFESLRDIYEVCVVNQRLQE